MDECKCGCGSIIKKQPWHKYKPVRFVSGHNIKPINPLSLLDKTKDHRKNQTGFLAPKIVANIRRDAKKAGYDWQLEDTFVFKLITSDCAYCGEKSGWPQKRNGIDRVDSSVGYLKVNCVPSCSMCNRAKNNKSEDEFVRWGIKFYHQCVRNGSASKVGAN